MKAKPTALKKLQGNPGKRPLNKYEPKPDNTKPRCPSHLNASAKAEWKRMATKLHDIGLLTYIDKAALAAYCQAYGRWVEAEKVVKKTGILYTTEKGNIIQHPSVGVANTAMRDMMKYASEFGMTPSARSKIKVDAPVKDEDLASQLFGIVNGK